MKSQGLSIVEVLVALAIIGIILTTVFTGLLSNALLNDKTEQKSGGAIAVQRVLDATRVGDPKDLPSSGTSAAQSIVVNNRTYQVYTDYCTVAQYCTASARSLRVRAQFGSVDVASAETVYTSVNSTVSSN